MQTRRLAFTGHIAGFGSVLGVRMVLGVWDQSPFGAFADVMVQTADDERILLAPTAQIAEFVSATYHFDRIELGPVRTQRSRRALTVSTPVLQATVSIGGPAPIDWLLRLVPGRLATAPWWLRTIDPVASRIVRGVRTAGSAGNGRREAVRARSSVGENRPEKGRAARRAGRRTQVSPEHRAFGVVFGWFGAVFSAAARFG